MREDADVPLVQMVNGLGSVNVKLSLSGATHHCQPLRTARLPTLASRQRNHWPICPVVASTIPSF